MSHVVFFSIMCLMPFGYDVFALNEDPPLIQNHEEHGLDFKDCVKIAIQSAPALVNQSIDIEIKRLNESDSLWSFIPSFHMRTVTHVGLADGNETKVAFGVSEYNPILSYFSLQASKVLTEIAILSHQKLISESIYNMAQNFLELDFLDSMARCHENVLTEYARSFVYLKEQAQSGYATPLEVEIAKNDLEVARAEKERLLIQETVVKENLHQFMNMDASLLKIFQMQTIMQQLMDDRFDPARFDKSHVQAHSIERKIYSLGEALQNYRIQEAYSKFAPKVSVGVNKTSSLDARDQDSYYYTIHVGFNIWNGFSDANNVARQKMILRQHKNDIKQMELKLESTWKDSEIALKTVLSELNLARANEKLASLKVKQNHLKYLNDEKLFSALLKSRIAETGARKETLKRTLEYNRAIIKMRYLSGDLFNAFVKITPWEG